MAKRRRGGQKPISLNVTGDSGTATSDEAIALGLITTELVINALKHAFPSGRLQAIEYNRMHDSSAEGHITVAYESNPASWKLSIGDDGVGLAATDTGNREGLGTSIIESLASQLNATIQRKSSPQGTAVSVICLRDPAKTA